MKSFICCVVELNYIFTCRQFAVQIILAVTRYATAILTFSYVYSDCLSCSSCYRCSKVCIISIKADINCRRSIFCFFPASESKSYNVSRESNSLCKHTYFLVHFKCSSQCIRTVVCRCVNSVQIRCIQS